MLNNVLDIGTTRSVINAAMPIAHEGKKAERFWEFKNSAGSDEATLYVYGDIVTYDLEDWNWPDDVVPNKFKNELNALGDVGTIHVRINSYGGSVFAAYAIMNLLKAHKARIITYNDGIAASAATIIAMAGDKIVTALGSVWMVHLPLAPLCGYYNANDLKKQIDSLDTIAKSMIDIYSAKTGIDKAELETMMDKDEWMTGTSAYNKGFADEITGTEAVAYLSEDKKTAYFNGLNIEIDKIRGGEKLAGMLTVKPGTTAAKAANPVSAAFNGFLNAAHRGIETALESPHEEPKALQQLPEQSEPAEAATSKEKKEENIVDLNELKEKYPDIYNAAVNEGVVQGTQNERNRIKEIDAMALPGMEDLVNKAKYETGIAAGDFAVEVIKAQKQKGVNYYQDASADAAHLNNVPAGGQPVSNDEQEEKALLANAAERAKNIR